MTTERAKPDLPSQGKMTQAEILRLADLIGDELTAGDEASALRLVESILAQPVPVSLIDLLGQAIARNTAQKVPGPFLALLDDIADTQTPGAWPLIGSAIYAAFVRTMLPSTMQHARRHIARATNPDASDAIGERVPGQLLAHHFEEGLSPLYDWVSDPNPWVRRALGVAVHFYVRHNPYEQTQIARLLQLLSLLYEEKDTHVVQGIAQGFESISKCQPEMLTYWLYEQKEIGKQPQPLLLRSATAFLPDDVKAAFLKNKT